MQDEEIPNFMTFAWIELLHKLNLICHLILTIYMKTLECTYMNDKQYLYQNWWNILHIMILASVLVVLSPPQKQDAYDLKLPLVASK